MELSYSQGYNKGYYFTHDNHRVEGFLKLKCAAHFSDEPDNWVVFKRDKKSKKVELRTYDIKSYVVFKDVTISDENTEPAEKDSFAIGKNFRINNFAYFPEDFAKVIDHGKITLYKHYTTSGAERLPTWNYLIKKNYIVKLLTKKYFKEEYQELFKGHEALLQKIQSKEFSYEDIESLVRDYNVWFKKQGTLSVH